MFFGKFGGLVLRLQSWEENCVKLMANQMIFFDFQRKR